MVKKGHKIVRVKNGHFWVFSCWKLSFQVIFRLFFQNGRIIYGDLFSEPPCTIALALKVCSATVCYPAAIIGYKLLAKVALTSTNVKAITIAIWMLCVATHLVVSTASVTKVFMETASIALILTSATRTRTYVETVCAKINMEVMSVNVITVSK